jgi:hypothetical protein
LRKASGDESQYENAEPFHAISMIEARGHLAAGLLGIGKQLADRFGLMDSVEQEGIVPVR